MLNTQKLLGRMPAISSCYKSYATICVSLCLAFVLLSSCVPDDTDTAGDIVVSEPAGEQAVDISIPGFLISHRFAVPGGYIEAIAPLPLDQETQDAMAESEAEGRGTLSLLDNQGNVLRRASRVIVTIPGYKRCEYFLLGLDSWLSAGDYVLEYIAGSAESSEATVKRYVLPVTSREFPRSVISLNRRLTNIRTDESVERRRQSQELNDLLTSYDPGTDYLLASNAASLPVQEVYHTDEFGSRRVYRYSDGSTASSIHYGVDYRAAVGVQVMAPFEGRVVMNQFRNVTGNTLVIEHLPGVFTMYYHLDHIFVEVGDELAAGTPIATAGMTGLATGSHLHWELRIRAAAVDPELFLQSAILDKGNFSSYFRISNQ